jgi:hypothetical protein
MLPHFMPKLVMGTLWSTKMTLAHNTCASAMTCRSAEDTKMQPGTGTLTQGGLQELEDRIRDAVRAKRSVSEDSVTLLSRLFK